MDQNKIIDRIQEALLDGMEAVNNDGIDIRTRILNAEYALGKYAAFMEVLENTDLSVFCALHEAAKDCIGHIMDFIDINQYRKAG